MSDSGSISGNYLILSSASIISGTAAGSRLHTVRSDSLVTCGAGGGVQQVPVFNQAETSTYFFDSGESIVGISEKPEPDGRNTADFGVVHLFCSSHSVDSGLNVDWDCSPLDWSYDNYVSGFCLHSPAQASTTLKAVDSTNTVFVSSSSTSQTYEIGVGGTRTDSWSWSFRAEKIPVPAIHGIELTQAMQVYQKLADFANTLADTNSPPIPIVAFKPLAIRVVLEKPTSTVNAVIEVVWNGVSLGSKPLTISPSCDPPDTTKVNRDPSSRDNASPDCRTADFILKSPTEGENRLLVKLYLPFGNTLVEEQAFFVNARTADTVILGAVNVCATRTAGNWNCLPTPVRDLRDGAVLMRKIYPTDTVAVVPTGHQVRLEIVNDDDGDMADCYDGSGITKIFDGKYVNGKLVVVNYQPRLGPIRQCEKEIWWDVAALRINRLFGLTEWALSGLGIQWYFYGLVRPNALTHPYYGSAHAIPGRGALGITTGNVVGLQNYTSRDVRDTVAHEVGHLFGLEHIPPDADTSGCGTFDIADGPPELYLFSDAPVKQEVAFDVERSKAIAPFVRHDMMSYCDGAPTWASPLTYKRLLNVLAPPTEEAGMYRPVPRSKAVGPPQSAPLVVAGEYWLVSGIIDEDTAYLGTIYEFDTVGTAETGEGSHRLEVQDSAGVVLFTRNFTPSAAYPRQTGPITRLSGLPPSFAQLIPIQASAARIVVRNPAGIAIGEESLAGVEPEINLVFPLGGEQIDGLQTLMWTATDKDSDAENLVYWVQYSADGGNNWLTLGQDLQDTSLEVDFDELPGALGTAMVRVLASDHTNTGSASSNAFTVGKKEPTVDILLPEGGASVENQALVFFEGFGYDLDDGVLPSDKHIWSSDLDGDIGVGHEFSSAVLSAGVHTIELSVTDSDGNAAATSVVLTVDEPSKTSRRRSVTHRKLRGSERKCDRAQNGVRCQHFSRGR